MPAIHLSYVLAVGARWDLGADTVLEGTGIDPLALDQPAATVTPSQALKVIGRLAERSGRDDVGIALGMLIKPMAHGALGDAAMSCATLAEAMQLLGRYRALLFADLTPSVVSDRDELTLRLIDSGPRGPSRQLIFESYLVMVCRHVGNLIGRVPDGWRVEVDWPEPAYFAAYRDRLPPWRFDQARPQICFPRASLAAPLVFADPVAKRWALARVERELAERSGGRADAVILRVRSCLRPGPSGYPALPVVAAMLCLSDRTLKRRLRLEGTSFQVLLDEARRCRASELMRSSRLNVGEIAHALGYSDPAAFSRAFKRWTGSCPSNLCPRTDVWSEEACEATWTKCTRAV